MGYLRSEPLIENGKKCLRVIGRDRWSHSFSLNNKLNELGLLLPLGVIGEPIIQILGACAPTVRDISCVVKRDIL